MFLILEMGSSAVDSARTGVFLIGGLGSFGRIRTFAGLGSFCGLGKLGKWSVRAGSTGQQGIWGIRKKRKYIFTPLHLFSNKYPAAHHLVEADHHYCITAQKGKWCRVGISWVRVCRIATDWALRAAVRRVGGGMGGMPGLSPRAAPPGV